MIFCPLEWQMGCSGARIKEIHNIALSYLDQVQHLILKIQGSVRNIGGTGWRDQGIVQVFVIIRFTRPRYQV